MSVLIVTAFFAALAFVLLSYTREPGRKPSAAIWIAFVWLWFSSTRNPTGWLPGGGGGKGSADTAYSEGSAIDRNVLTGLLLCGVVVLAKRPKRTSAFLAANYPIILFFLYCALSATWSDHPDISIKRWFRGVGDLVMVMVILTDVDWPAAFKWVYLRLACILIPLSVVFFRWFPALGRSYNIHDGRVSITGVTDDKNLLGAICTLFTMVVLWNMIEALQGKKRAKRVVLWGYGAIIAIALYLINLANAATATACLVEGAIIVILASRPKIYRRPGRVHFITGAILGFSAFNLFFGSSLLELLGRNATLTGRTELWTLVLKLVTNPVFGAGYESFWLGQRLEVMWNYIPGVNQAHNGYLEIYVNLGWIGVALLTLFLITGYRNIVNAIRRREPLASLRLAFFVVSCVANCTEAGFKMMHPLWVAALVACSARPSFAFASRRISEHKQKSETLSVAPEFASVLASR